MAFVPMAYAVTGQVASSSEYNKVVDNVNDLNARVTGWTGMGAYCHVYQSSTGTQTLASTTPTAVTFNAEVVDPSNFHSTVSNISRITPTLAGRYRVNGGLCIGAGGAGSAVSQIRKNGAVVLGSAPYQEKALYASGFVALMCQCTATIFCNGTTDYIEMWANHNNLLPISTFSNTTDQHSFLTVEWMGTT